MLYIISKEDVPLSKSLSLNFIQKNTKNTCTKIRSMLVACSHYSIDEVDTDHTESKFILK